MTEMVEKRAAPRVKADFPLRYREILANNPQYHGVQLKDLSLGGLRFQSESFLARDLHLILEVTLPETEKPLRVMSRVAWARRIPAGERYEIGSRFVELLPSYRKVLEGFLDSQAQARA